MDRNVPLARNQLALMIQGKAGNEEEQRAYRQFARDFVQIDAHGKRRIQRDGDLMILGGE